MPNTVRLQINRGAVRALLNSGPVVAALEAHGAAVLATANSMVTSSNDADYGPPFEMQTYTGGTRARVYVREASEDGHIAEAVHGVLTKAFGSHV